VVITERSDPAKMSVIPDQCRIVKVNGDYPSTLLKMTPADLASYAPDITDYQNRIFSEYGLIICGWSSADDTRLVEILGQDRVRRHSVYWCHQRERAAIPDKIMEDLEPSTIRISSADVFFGELHAQVGILRRYNTKERMTVATAIKKVRDALRDPRPDLILSDLINAETDLVYQELVSGRYPPEKSSEIVAKHFFKETLEDFERLTAPLAAMTAMIAYYDDGKNFDLIEDAIERLINIPAPDPKEFLGTRDMQGRDFHECLYGIRYYPALLIIYASGIAAVKKGHLGALEAILARPKMKTYVDSSLQRVPYHDEVNTWFTMVCVPHWILDYNLERYGMRVNVHYYLYRVVQSIIQTIIPNEHAYDGAFDTFEYLYGLFYLRLTASSLEGKSAAKPPRPLLSRVWVKTVGFNRPGDYAFPEPVISYLRDIQRKAEGSDFFDGDLQEFERRHREFAKFFGVDAPKTGIVLPSPPRVLGLG